MSQYIVYVADKFTKIPLVSYEVSATSKYQAKLKVYKWNGKDKTLIYTASKIKGGEEE